jgi:hypothetical protein
MQWFVRSLSSITADVDAMLDTEPCPMNDVEGWVNGFQTLWKQMGSSTPRKRSRTVLNRHERSHADLRESCSRRSVSVR